MNKDITLSPKLEEIAIKIDAHGKAAIENILTVGKLLCEAREVLPANNEFGEWREKRLPWITQKLSERWVNVYKNGGENLLRHNVATTVLYELTAPSVPDSAREEAMEHESLTVKQSKELVQAHKDLEDLKAENQRLKDDKKTPEPANLDNLIPALKEMLDDGLIMPAMARNLSTMTNDGQRAWVTIHTQKMSAERQLSERNLRIKELESRPEPEPTIIEKIIEVMPEGSEQKIKDAETKIKQADKILKSMAALQAKKEEVEAKAESLNSERNELERKIKALEAKEQTKTPGAIDDSRAIKLARIVKELDWIFPDILKEAELSGGYMPKSKEEIGEIIRRWSQLLSQIDGQSVIDI